MAAKPVQAPQRPGRKPTGTTPFQEILSERELTHLEVETATGIPQMQISRYGQGRRAPDFKNVELLMRFLGHEDPRISDIRKIFPAYPLSEQAAKTKAKLKVKTKARAKR